MNAKTVFLLALFLGTMFSSVLSHTQVDAAPLVLNGFSSTPTSTAGVDKVIAALNKYGGNCYRASFNPPWVTSGSRPWNPSLVTYFLAHCSYYIVVDRIHLAPPTSICDWAALESAIFSDVLARWGNNPRVLVEVASEYHGTDQFARAQAFINDVRAAGYTNAIVFNKQPSQVAWVKLVDPLGKTYEGCHYYFGDGENNLAYTETRTLQALNMGIKVADTEAGAAWGEYKDFTSANVARTSQWLAWSRAHGVGNMVWLNKDTSNLAKYESLGLVIPK